MAEHDEQARYVRWVRNAFPNFVLASFPNGFYGGGRGNVVAHMAKLKAEGLLPGMPDLILCVPRGPFHGLFLEFKVGKNKPSVRQLAVKERLEEYGYKVVVVYSAEEAVKQTLEYLGLQDETK